MQKPHIDGLRFICFIGVFLVHANKSVFAPGAFGLPVFFLLSGFLITRILVHSDSNNLKGSLKSFYIRRALRTFPAYYLVATLYWLLKPGIHYLAMFTYTYNFSFFKLGGNVNEALLTRNQVPDVGNMGSHLWSMSVEEQFYLFFPLLILLTAKTGRFLIIFFLIGLCWLYQYYMYTPPVLKFYGALLPGCGEYILWGSLFYIIFFYYRHWIEKINPLWITLSGIILFVFFYTVDSPNHVYGMVVFWPPKYQFIYAISFGLIVLGLWSDQKSIFKKLLSVNLISYFGKTAYGLYLFHMFSWEIVDFAASKYPHFGGDIVKGIAKFILTLILGSICWELYEKRINNLKKHFPLTGKEFVD